MGKRQGAVPIVGKRIDPQLIAPVNQFEVGQVVGRPCGFDMQNARFKIQGVAGKAEKTADNRFFSRRIMGGKRNDALKGNK